MPRNLDHRIEVLVPVENARVRQEIHAILDSALADDVNAWILEPTGEWVRAAARETGQAALPSRDDDAPLAQARTPRRTRATCRVARPRSPKSSSCASTTPDAVRWQRDSFACVLRDAIQVRSAGSDPADSINPAVIEAMAELGVDMSEEFPKPLTDDAVRAADVVITMGCGDACPIYPGKRYEDWVLDDPAGQDLETVRRIRDEIDARVTALVGDARDRRRRLRLRASQRVTVARREPSDGGAT